MARVLATIVCVDNDWNIIRHTKCISNDNEVYAFGAFGKTKSEMPERESIPKVIPSLHNITALDIGSDHSMFLDSDGNVFTLGCNTYGQLGIEDYRIRLLEFNDDPQKVNLPSGIIQICCGDNFSLCLSEERKVYSFGNNNYGQLGLRRNIVKTYSPQLIETLKDVEFIECGHLFVFCKTLDNQIYCWGCNDKQQLGLENTDTKYTPFKCSDFPTNIVDIKCGKDHSLFLTSNQEVFCCGSNYSGQLGNSTCQSSALQKIENFSEIIRIECGNYHSTCLDENGNLYVFGRNSRGQLGLGDITDRYEPIKHPLLSNIIDISKGGDHTFVKTSNNEIFSMGSNVYLESGTRATGMLKTPKRSLERKENIWYSNTQRKSKAKSARFIVS